HAESGEKNGRADYHSGMTARPGRDPSPCAAPAFRMGPRLTESSGRTGATKPVSDPQSNAPGHTPQYDRRNAESQSDPQRAPGAREREFQIPRQRNGNG